MDEDCGARSSDSNSSSVAEETDGWSNSDNEAVRNHIHAKSDSRMKPAIGKHWQFVRRARTALVQDSKSKCTKTYSEPASSSQAGVAPRRRSSVAHAEDHLNRLDRRLSARHNSDNDAHVPKNTNCADNGNDSVPPTPADGLPTEERQQSAMPGQEWLAKVQSTEEVRNRTKDVCKQLLSMMEIFGFDVSRLPGKDKIQLQERFGGEIHGVLQLVAKSALDSVRDDWEELNSLRKVVADLDDKIANMNRTYLLEVSASRDRYRTPSDVVADVCTKFGYDASGEDGGHIEFYEPLQYLSDDVRSTVLLILDEKIKAIFSFDPSVRDQTNAVEMARFEDAARDDRLKSFEKLNAKLRDESREARNKVSRLEKNLEKGSWEFTQAQVEIKRLETQLNDILHKPTCDAETQSINVEPPVKVPTEPASDNDQRAINQGQRKAPFLRRESCPPDSKPSPNRSMRDVAVQVDASPPSPGDWKRRRADGGDGSPHSSNSPRLKKKDFFTAALERERIYEDPISPRAESQLQLNKLRRDCEKAMQAVRIRDKRIEQLEMELKQTQAQLDNLEIEQAHLQAAQLHASGEGLDCNEGTGISIDVTSQMVSEEEFAEVQQRVEAETERANQALQQADILRQQVCALHHDVTRAQEEVAKSEQRRVEVFNACTTGSVAQELSSELATSIRARNNLAEELDQLKAALSMALSRNAALEVAVACHTSGPASGFPRSQQKTQGTVEREAKQMENLHGQKTELREKVSIQKEQLAELVQENTTLHLALDEMQQEVRHLTQQLRSSLPDIEVMDANLESVLSRMDKVVRNGGGAYVRLHKEQKLRDIASAVRTAKRTVCETEEDAKPTPRTPSTPSTARDRAPLQRGRLVELGRLQSNSTPFMELPPRTPGNAKSPCFSIPCPSVEVFPRTPGIAKLPSLGHRSPSRRPVADARHAVAQTSRLPCEQRGCLLLGGKGGMAVLGGAGTQKMNAKA